MRKTLVILMSLIIGITILGGFQVFASGNKTTSRDLVLSTEDNYGSVKYNASVNINFNSGNVTYGGNANSSNVAIINDANGYTLSSSLTSPLKITLTGSLSGTFAVRTTSAEYAIILNNVTLNAEDRPAFNLLSQ